MSRCALFSPHNARNMMMMMMGAAWGQSQGHRGQNRASLGHLAITWGHVGQLGGQGRGHRGQLPPPLAPPMSPAMGLWGTCHPSTSNCLTFQVTSEGTDADIRLHVVSYAVKIDWRRSAVVSGIGLINEVNRHLARLVLGWVTVCGRVNHLGM